MVVAEMKITVKEFNEKALKLNGSVRITKSLFGVSVKSEDQIKKGVFNYSLKNQRELDKVVSLNGELRCHLIDFAPEKCCLFERIASLFINQNNYESYLKHTFNRIDTIKFFDLSSSQIKAFLKRINRIGYLLFHETKLSSLDLSSVKANKIAFMDSVFNGKIILPHNIDLLSLLGSRNINFLSFSKVSQIYLDSNSSEQVKDEISFFRKLRKTKILRASCKIPLSECLDLFPRSVRVIEYTGECDFENLDLVKANRKLPYLIRIKGKIPIFMAQKLNLRHIRGEIQETEDKFTFRPRKIEIEENDWTNLSKHLELFERIEEASIQSDKFNFDLLTERIKKIKFNLPINFKSRLLSRFKGKCMEIKRN